MLRECGAQSSKVCPECGRAACDAHMVLAVDGRNWLCVDCHGRGDDEANPETLGDNPTAWRHGYRDSYYRGHHYAPFFFGAYYHSYYDDYDVRSFDREMAESEDLPADDGGPDFMDS